MVLRRRLSSPDRKSLYQEYLKTPHWKERRARALDKAGNHCQQCGKSARLEVHHLTYAHLFAELDEDLIVLCRGCHGRQHKHYGEDDMLDLNTRNSGGRVAHLIDTAMQAESKRKDEERLATRTPRIGASRLGETCMRKLQYEYFKAPKDKDFSGKALRIFRRGHEGEDWMAEWLRLAGFQLFTVDADGGQKCFRALQGRVLGYADGVVLGGPEECGPYPRLWENKVLGAKGWNKLDKDGVRRAYPVYYGQVQLYMAYFDLTDAPALFTALNGDTMEIFAEDVRFDAQAAQELSDKAVNLVSACEAGELLPRCTDREDWFECKFCDWHNRCWA